jgi:hypothetical protein
MNVGLRVGQYAATSRTPGIEAPKPTFGDTGCSE